MKNRSLLAALALPLLAAPALAQDWLREEPLDVIPQAIIPRQGGGTVDLAQDQVNDVSLLRSVNHDGTTQSRYRLDAVLGGRLRVNQLTPVPDGRIALIGSANYEAPIEINPWLGLVEPDTGAGGWHREITTGPTEPDQYLSLNDALVIGDGLYAFGRIPATGELLILRFDLAGNLQWSKQAAVGNHTAYSPRIAPTSSGGFVLVFIDEQADTHAIAFDASADVEWHAYYDTLEAQAVCRTENGEIWIAGSEISGELVVLALSASGQKLWSQEYLGYPYVGTTLRPTADGGAVLCGSRTPEGAYRPTLLGLDATGTPMWQRMYDLSSLPSVDPHETVLGNNVVDAGAAGWILEVIEFTKAYHLAVQPDGSASLPCVDVLDLATFAVPTSTGPDEPPDVVVQSLDLVSSPLLVQALPEADPMPLVCGSPCSVTFTTTGSALPGSGFIAPELAGIDGACVGAPRPRLELTKGLGGTVGVLGYSIGTSYLDLLGGTMVLDFQTLVTLPITLDGPAGVAGAGTWSLEIEPSLVEMMGLTLAAQTMLYDPGAVQGWSFSRGLLFWIF